MITKSNDVSSYLNKSKDNLSLKIDLPVIFFSKYCYVLWCFSTVVKQHYYLYPNLLKFPVYLFV